MSQLMCNSDEGHSMAHVSPEVDERHNGRVEVSVVASNWLSFLAYSTGGPCGGIIGRRGKAKREAILRQILLVAGN